MSNTFQIQTLLEEDIPFLTEITPSDWNDIALIYRAHFNQDYFFPIKIILKNKIVGVGELIINGNIGWLGNIVVRNEFRNQGFGKLITERLIEIAYEKKCESIYLLATPLGKFVYEKLNFQTNGKYLFFINSTDPKKEKNNNNILPYNKIYKDDVLNLDKLAMGEDRSKVLIHYLEDGWIYKKPNDSNASGFFLPNLGDGLIICNNKLTGLELINKRTSMGKPYIVFPEENETLISHLKQNRYSEYRQATFMYLGKMKTWNPKMVYSRIGGFIG